MTNPIHGPSAIVHHPDMAQYDFGPYHPLRPERIDTGFDLLRTAGLWDTERELVVPDAATIQELAAVHSSEYIGAVERAGSGDLPSQLYGRFGLRSTDNPPFPDMHDASALIAGGTLRAVRDVMQGHLLHAFVPAGGLHHAQRDRASGFCVYNDPAVAAAVAVAEFGARVMYIDLDCHHGDGVQWIFYGDPNVLSVSFHESGRYLFPGTGFVEETGEGAGEGYSVNVPFMPYTQDATWIEALRMLDSLAARFAPDLLLTNHGCDTHLWDPLTHLALTTRSFCEGARLAHNLAHRYTGGRWVTVGSGGYDWVRVVPRSWAILWAEMTNRTLPVALPEEWIGRWRDHADDGMPSTFQDGPETVVGQWSETVDEANREMFQSVRMVHHLDETS